MSDERQDRMAHLISRLSDDELKMSEIIGKMNADIKALQDQATEEVAPLLGFRDHAMTELIELMRALMADGTIKGKSIVLPAGTLTVKQSTSVNIKNATRLMRRASWMRLIEKISERQERKLSKTKIKKLLEQQPELATKLADVVAIESFDNFTLKFSRALVDLKRDVPSLHEAHPSTAE